MLVCNNFNHVIHDGQCLDVATVGVHAVTLHNQFYPRKQLPLFGLRRAAGSNQASFGAAINFC